MTRHPLFLILVASLLLTLAPASSAVAEEIQWRKLSQPGMVEHYFERFATRANKNPTDVNARVLGSEFAYYLWRLEKDPAKRLRLAKTVFKLADEAVKIDHQNSGGWYWHGSGIALIGLTRGVLNSLQLVPAGKRSMEKAIELDPDFRDGMAKANLGRLYMVLPGFPISIGDIEQASKLLHDGAAAYPDSTYFPLYLADLYWSIGNTERALHWVEETLKKKPRNDYTAFMTPINQRKAREVAAEIKAGNERDRFNDVLSDHESAGIVN